MKSGILITIILALGATAFGSARETCGLVDYKKLGTPRVSAPFQPGEYVLHNGGADYVFNVHTELQGNEQEITDNVIRANILRSAVGKYVCVDGTVQDVQLANYQHVQFISHFSNMRQVR